MLQRKLGGASVLIPCWNNCRVRRTINCLGNREWSREAYLVCMSEAHSIASVQDGGEVKSHLTLAQLGDVAEPRQLVVQGNVLQLLQGHRDHPSHPGEGGEPLLSQGVQKALDKANVVQIVNPYRAAQVVRVIAKFTIFVHGRPSGQAVFDVSSSQSESEHLDKEESCESHCHLWSLSLPRGWMARLSQPVHWYTWPSLLELILHSFWPERTRTNTRQ